MKALWGLEAGVVIQISRGPITSYHGIYGMKFEMPRNSCLLTYIGMILYERAQVNFYITTTSTFFEDAP